MKKKWSISSYGSYEVNIFSEKNCFALLDIKNLFNNEVKNKFDHKNWKKFSRYLNHDLI